VQPNRGHYRQTGQYAASVRKRGRRGHEETVDESTSR
jgi:hypothetical protein